MIEIWKQTWWSNDKTIIELGYRKISWFVSVSQNNMRLRLRQIICSLVTNHDILLNLVQLLLIIINQTHYEKSDWSRAFNQFTIACEPDMINAISAADIAFIMSSSTSSRLLSPLECSPQKRNGWTLRFSVSEAEFYEKCIIKQLLNSVFAWYHELSKPRVCVICFSLRFRQITQTLVLIIHDIMLNLIQ